jgi:DNA-binding LacI/PurR family transcriptional regulator
VTDAGTTISRRGVNGASSVYQRLAAKLRRTITDKPLAPGALVASEHELARREGISRKSVRRAVDVLVREGLAERRPGKGLYVRNPASTSRLVQIVVPSWESPFYARIAQGAKRVGLKAGVQTQIYDAHGDFDSDLQAVQNLPETAARGAIIASVHHERFARVLYELEAADYPFVLVDETLRDIRVPSVLADNYQGGYRVGKELIDRGHRRIAFVGFFAADTVRRRLAGLRDALGDAHLPFDRSLIGELRGEALVAEGWADAVGHVARKILGRADRPTAIFFCNDPAAAHAYPVIRSLGLRIPADVSVVGFDGNAMCRLLTPTLATVRQPLLEMGAAAMEMLLALMDGDSMARGSRMEAGVVHRAARTPAAARDGSEANGRADTTTRGQSGGGGMKAESGRNGYEVSVAGRRVAPMETQAREFSRPRRPAANTTDQDSVWHRVLPVTWQDGESIGPAPGAAGDFTTKDTRTSDSASDPDSQPRAGEIGTGAAKSAEEIRRTDMEMVGV